MAITTCDIARSLSITQATVSRALRNDPAIAKTTQLRVKQEAERLGYRPNLLAKSLSEQKTRMVGLIINISTEELAAIKLFFVDKFIRAAGYHIHVSFVVDEESFIEAIDNMAARRVDGYLILANVAKSWKKVEKLLLELPDTKVSLGTRAVAGCHGVIIDQAAGVELLVDHLAHLGHREICMVHPEWSHGETRQENRRFQGFLNGMAKHDIDGGEHRIVQLCSLNHKDGCPVIDMKESQIGLAKLLKEHPKCTALVCSNDVMAQTILYNLNKLGLRVPKDISVAGFDDIGSSQRSCPPLTTVSQCIDESVSHAVGMLFDGIKNRELTEQRTVVLTKLVVRESTGPARHGELKSISFE